MRGYGQQFCPITRAAEIFATRWTPIIVRNLLLGSRTFSDIRAGAPGIPRTLLSERLRSLERYGILERRPNPHGRGFVYHLTPSGRELQEVCDALGTWGARWLEAAPAGLDPGVVLWAVSKSIDRDRLPEERVVIRFNFQDEPKHQFWLLVQRPEPEVCRKPPGFPEDLVVTTETEWLAKWHMGRISLGQAMRWRVMTIEGPRRLVTALSTWGGVTPFAAVAPARAAREVPAGA